LEVVTWFAVLASTDAATGGGFPTPNQIIAETFGLDAVNQNEELNAVIRQMQKHALLYSTGSGMNAGDWRPAFLSDWVRAALLVRAWSRRDKFPGVPTEAVTRSIVTAQRARIGFEYIFPDRLPRLGGLVMTELLGHLATAADGGSPEACGNFWFLMQGFTDEERAAASAKPSRVVELTDLSEAEFEGHVFGEEFTSNLAVFVRTHFASCTFTNCRFTQCDFTEANFSNCTFRQVSFQHCNGPAYFEDCTFDDVQFEDVLSHELPAWKFARCQFGSACQVVQSILACPDEYAPVAEFEECTSEGDPLRILVGPVLGQEPKLFTGLVAATAAAAADPAVQCLRQLIRPFFPSRIGAPGTHQARDYIRTSALGRGVFPKGAPSPTELTSFLTAESFTKGGRTGHLYAPWSEVGGTTRPELRGEFSAFLRSSLSQGTTVKRLLDKIRKAAGW
jgi:hypothetical protein